MNIPLLADIDRPIHLNIETAASLPALIMSAGEESLFGTGGQVFFGTAYIQGNRLMFATAMPLDDLLKISEVHRSRKTANLNEVDEEANRPAEVAHGKSLNQYLKDTACRGENWIVPALTLNYGVNLNDDDIPIRMMMITRGNMEGATSWPAVLIVPPGARFDMTDGAHRKSQFDAILKDPKVSDAQKDRIRQNAVAVIFVFEKSRIHSHQDFADCAKAKAIQKSLVVSYDIRDDKNKRTRDLVKAVPFLMHYVDATAANVNLSGKSTKIWSMSAVRLFTNHVAENHPSGILAPLSGKMTHAEAFFNALIQHVSELRALAPAVPGAPPPPVGVEVPSTGSLREYRGGNIVLRGIGVGIFARAYLTALLYGVDFVAMAKALDEVDWHVLTIQKPAADDPDFQAKVAGALAPLWSHMIAITESRFRISSSASDADIAWSKIMTTVPAVKALIPSLDVDEAA
ncbi:MAG: DNA sulfur modification protein DndB [Microvirga sp.]